MIAVLPEPTEHDGKANLRINFKKKKKKKKKSILLENFSGTVDVGRSKCEKKNTMTAQLHRDITINNSKYEGWCCGPPSYLNQLMHFSLTSGSIRHADRSFWHLRSTFPYIHTGTIINRDKQSKITHLPCCFSTLFSLASYSIFWRQSSSISHLETQARQAITVRSADLTEIHFRYV